MKKLLLALLLIAPMANADWAVTSTKRSALGTSAVDKTYVSLEYSSGEILMIYFNVFHNTCTEFSDETYNEIIKVNDQSIKARSQCTGDRKVAIFPLTDAGYNFVVNEFKKSQSVTVQYNDSFSSVYSAKGFTKALGILSDKLNQAI